MTNLEALSESVNYPVSDRKLLKILIDRDVNEHEEYLGTFPDFELAKADLYVLLASSPNISEGDMSISTSDRETYKRLAGSIYSRYGVENPLEGSSKPSRIRNRSHYW